MNLARRIENLEQRGPGRMPLTRFSRKAAALSRLSGSAYEAALQNLLRESPDEELELFIVESETAAGRLCRLPLSDADLERIVAGGSERECLKTGA
jgi:hypothetical protein